MVPRFRSGRRTWFRVGIRNGFRALEWPRRENVGRKYVSKILYFTAGGSEQLLEEPAVIIIPTGMSSARELILPP